MAAVLDGLPGLRLIAVVPAELKSALACLRRAIWASISERIDFRGTRTRPSSTDQALGRSETVRQGHRRSIVEVEEKNREGHRLTGS